MAEELPKPAEGLTLSRWSRLKREQRAGVVAEPPRVLPAASPAASSPAVVAAPAVAAGANGAEVLALPEMSSISLTEDFTPFMQAKVPQLIKQQALKALFKSPHFNVMDGLDTYIDDYTVFEPISPEEMSKLSAWQSIQNPLQQVVTPGGYAVDVKSEEGMAVLAERERIAALEASGTDAMATEADGVAVDEQPSAEPPKIASPNAPSSHPRYGRRVGDFNATAEQLEPADAAESEMAIDHSASIETIAAGDVGQRLDQVRANGG